MGRSSKMLVAAVAACGALLAGCGAGPSQAGSSAIVGDQGVSLADTQSRINAALAQPGLVDSAIPGVVSGLLSEDPTNPKYQHLSADDQRNLTEALLGRLIVTQQVRHLLLDAAAAQAHVTITDGQVNSILAAPGIKEQLEGANLAFDPQSQRQVVRDRLTAMALAIQQLGSLNITADVITLGSKQQAEQTARALAAGGQQAQAALKAAGQNAHGVQLTGVQAAQSWPFLIGTLQGQVVGAPIGQDSWGVWRVTRRSTTPHGAPAGLDVGAIGADALEKLGDQLTQPLASKLGVRVNPRFGVWDPVGQVVVGSDTPVSFVLSSDSAS